MHRTIYETAMRLSKRYESTNPFTVAREMHIDVLYEPLGTIRGYYSHFSRKKIIHINSDLEDDQQLLVCAHELGHAVLHPKSNTPFLRKYTFFSVDKLETEANRFMACFLYSDDELEEYRDCSIDHVCRILGLPWELVQWRYNQIRQ